MTHAQRICTIALAIACLLESFTGRPTLAAEPKRVLLLYYSFGGNLVNARQFRAELERQSKELLEIYDAPLLSARPVDEPIVRRYADYLNALLPDKRLDLIVPVGASAVRLLYHYRSQLFPAAPVLAIAEGRRLPAELRENGTVIATSIDITKVIENILQVRPETTNIAVVVGNSPSERFWVQETQAAFRPYAERVSIEYFNDLPFDEMLKRAATLPLRSAIFFFVLLTDAAGTTHEDVTVFSRLHAVANAPIFSYYDVNFGKGIVGGPLLSVENRSRLAASVALRILAGEAPGSIKTPPIGFAAPKFDWREMQRWGISESNLPPGSEIHFRELTAWERYRAQILLICAALLAQAALIGWLIYEHRRRHQAEILARNSMSELTHMNRLATAGELSASIAHEVNQPLTGITTRANAALHWLASETPNIDRARAALSQIVTAGHRASDIITSIRAMFKKDTNERVPIDVNQLITSVLAIVRVDLLRNRVEVYTELDEPAPTVVGDKVQLQQVILNLVMNASEAMHSVRPRVLKVKSEQRKPNIVHVSIEDNGTGVDPANLDRIFKPLFTTKERGMGVGLSICHSIIQNHDGRIWVSPAAGRGSIFQFELPVHRHNGPQTDQKPSNYAMSAD
jgi:signal transduction histidine kinase